MGTVLNNASAVLDRFRFEGIRDMRPKLLDNNLITP